MSAQPIIDNTALAKKQLAKARVGMMATGSAFITSVCFSLRQEFTTDVERAGTDGRTIFYNPDWFVTIPHREQIGLVVHETWHVALNHCKMQKYSRMGKRDAKLWNVSCDACINNYILDCGMHLPVDAMGFIHMPEMRGKSTEQIYEELLSKAQAGEPVPVLDAANEDVMDPEPDENGEPGSGVDLSEMDDDIKQILVRASLVSKMSNEDPGHLPAGLEFQLEQITNPKLPWPRLVSRYFTAKARTLYNHLRPNRRYYPKHYLPSRSSKTLDRVYTAIDMSSSCSDNQIKQFVTEVASALRMVMPRELTLVEFDTSVTQVSKLKGAQDLVNHTFKGRGGTDITPVIELANQDTPDLLVVFTDGGFYPSRVDPLIPILWVIYDNPGWTSEYGTVIHVEVD